MADWLENWNIRSMVIFPLPVGSRRDVWDFCPRGTFAQDMREVALDGLLPAPYTLLLPCAGAGAGAGFGAGLRPKNSTFVRPSGSLGPRSPTRPGTVRRYQLQVGLQHTLSPRQQPRLLVMLVGASEVPSTLDDSQLG